MRYMNIHWGVNTHCRVRIREGEKERGTAARPGPSAVVSYHQSKTGN
jgi:hypothetical protein